MYRGWWGVTHGLEQRSDILQLRLQRDALPLQQHDRLTSLLAATTLIIQQRLQLLKTPAHHITSCNVCNVNQLHRCTYDVLFSLSISLLFFLSFFFLLFFSFYPLPAPPPPPLLLYLLLRATGTVREQRLRIHTH